ncbi:hypothetical protein BURPSS13_I0095 [Burkholderia pseudomallei S13]|nr:hypothetical protein BURPSS13_I0095 [Burkholderia pseudomallei S13]
MSALRAAAPRAPGRAGTRRPPGSLLLCFSAFALPCLAAPFSLRCVTFLLRSVGSPHRHVAASPCRTARSSMPRVHRCTRGYFFRRFRTRGVTASHRSPAHDGIRRHAPRTGTLRARDNTPRSGCRHTAQAGVAAANAGVATHGHPSMGARVQPRRRMRPHCRRFDGAPFDRDCVASRPSIKVNDRAFIDALKRQILYNRRRSTPCAFRPRRSRPRRPRAANARTARGTAHS